MRGIRETHYWQMVGAIFPYDYYRPSAPPTVDNEQFTREPYNDRNYEIFTILANVRNEHNELIDPISEPRGVPDDVSLEGQEWCKDADSHSHSWLSMDEITRYRIEDAKGITTGTPTSWWYLVNRLRQFSRQYGIKTEDIRLLFFFDN